MRKAAGFTLIELIVALIVIGILVTLAYPNYARSLERTRCAFAMNMLKTMHSAACVYFRENQTFAGMTLAGLETLAGANFYSDNSHPHWQFAVAAANPNNFALRATRLKGPHAGDFIELTSEEQWSNSSYPYQNPGEF